MHVVMLCDEMWILDYHVCVSTILLMCIKLDCLWIFYLTQHMTGKLPKSNFDEEEKAIEQAKSVIANRVEEGR